MITKEYVISLLENYNSKKRQIELLRFEQMNIPNISETDIIESLSLGSNLSGGGSTRGHISDKTLMIAMSFQDIQSQYIYDTAMEVSRELRVLEDDVNKLEHCLSLLDEKKSSVLQLYYFEEQTLAEISKEIGVTTRTVSKYRDDAIDELLSMYLFLRGVKKE